MHKTNEQPLTERGPSFHQISRRASYGVCLNLENQVIATHREFAILRNCAKMIMEKPGQVLHILSPGNMARTKYLVKTLMHLGVSCGQINVDLVNYNEKTPNGIWLLVTDSADRRAA